MSVLCNRAIEAIKKRPNDAIDVVLFVLAMSGSSDVAEAFDEAILGTFPPRDWSKYSLDKENGIVLTDEQDDYIRVPVSLNTTVLL